MDTLVRVSMAIIYLFTFPQLFSAQPLDQMGHPTTIASQIILPRLMISPSLIIGKVDTPINVTVSLEDHQQPGSQIKVFWETTASYVSTVEQEGYLVLDRENGFNNTINLRSSLLGIYSIKFFVRDDYNKIYFNNGTGTDLIVTRKTESFKQALTFTLMGLVTVALFLVGMDIDLNIVKKILMRPIGPAIGLTCQFLMMPLIAYVVGYLLLDSNYERLGFLFAGCSPGGTNSNLWTSLFGGDVDLSVTMTFISILCSFAMTTFWIYFLGSPLVSEDVKIPYLRLFLALFSLIIPIILGILFKWKLPKQAEFIKKYITKPFFLLVAIIIIILGYITNSFFFYLCTWKHIVSGLLLGGLGYIFGAGMAAVFCQGRPQIIAISLETAMQNVGICYAAINLALKSPYSDIAVLPMIAYLLMSTGPPVYITYVIYFVVRKIKGSSEEIELGQPKTGVSNDGYLGE